MIFQKNIKNQIHFFYNQLQPTTISSISKMNMIKCILFLALFSMSAAMGFHPIKATVQYKANSISDKDKVLAFLRRGRINRSRTGHMFY